MDPNELYSMDYFHGEVYQNYIQEEQFRKKNFRIKLNKIKKYIPEQGRVLDFGCAMGYFLDVAREDDYEVCGVEISKYASEYAVNTGKHTVYNGDLISGNFADDFFDIITMWDVLEHLYNPVEILSETNRILKKNGALIIETLNISSFAARIMKKNWPLFSPPYHLFYFNFETLTGLLNKTGFNTIKIIPVQTYVRLFKKYRALRYYKYPIIKSVLSKLFDDVLIVVASKN